MSTRTRAVRLKLNAIVLAEFPLSCSEHCRFCKAHGFFVTRYYCEAFGEELPVDSHRRPRRTEGCMNAEKDVP